MSRIIYAHAGNIYAHITEHNLPAIENTLRHDYADLRRGLCIVMQPVVLELGAELLAHGVCRNGASTCATALN